MKVVTSIKEAREIIERWKKEVGTIGLVPTMGRLHEGHQGVFNRAVKENDKVVVSIVTELLPRCQKSRKLDEEGLDKDLRLCEKNGVDLVFYPELSEMYGEGFASAIEVYEQIENVWCPKSPLYYQGVSTAVAKLFHILTPDKAYFGEKDARQLAMIGQMVQDLNFHVRIVGCPVTREDDGLAKSAKNNELSPEERIAAAVLNRALQAGRAAIEQGEKNGAAIVNKMTEIIKEERLAKIEYVELLNWKDLLPTVTMTDHVLGAVAVYVGETRLRDNFIWDEKVEKLKTTKK